MFDEPLSSISDEKEISDIFKQAVDNLIKAGKTVIVSTQNPSVSPSLKKKNLIKKKLKPRSFAVTEILQSNLLGRR